MVDQTDLFILRDTTDLGYLDNGSGSSDRLGVHAPGRTTWSRRRTASFPTSTFSTRSARKHPSAARLVARTRRDISVQAVGQRHHPLVDDHRPAACTAGPHDRAELGRNRPHVRSRDRSADPATRPAGEHQRNSHAAPRHGSSSTTSGRSVLTTQRREQHAFDLRLDDVLQVGPRDNRRELVPL